MLKCSARGSEYEAGSSDDGGGVKEGFGIKHSGEYDVGGAVCGDGGGDGGDEEGGVFQR